MVVLLPQILDQLLLDHHLHAWQKILVAKVQHVNQILRADLRLAQIEELEHLLYQDWVVIFHLVDNLSFLAALSLPELYEAPEIFRLADKHLAVAPQLLLLLTFLTIEREHYISISLSVLV